MDIPTGFDRRAFLARTAGACQVSALGFVLPRWSVLDSPDTGGDARGEVRRVMLHEVSAAVFSVHLGSDFHILRDSAPDVTVKLVEATPLPACVPVGASDTKREPCSIIFSGPLEPVLSQQIYRIRHAELGRLELFLVPLGPGTDGMRYEAVFN